MGRRRHGASLPARPPAFMPDEMGGLLIVAAERGAAPSMHEKPSAMRLLVRSAEMTQLSAKSDPAPDRCDAVCSG